MINGNYTGEGRLTTSLKDVRLMLEQGQRFGAPLFIAGIFSQIAQAGYEMGYAGLDPSCIIEVLRGMAGLPPRGAEIPK